MSISDGPEIPATDDIPELPKTSQPADLETGPGTFNEHERNDLPLYRTERIIASLTVAWVIILTTYTLFQNNELSYTSVYFLKIILSLSGAVMLATLPGFFDVSYTVSGFSVRAAGGAAAFVFIYTQSPNLPVIDKFEKSTAPPVEEQHSRKERSNDRLSVLTDEYPFLFVLSVSPASFTPAFTRTQAARNREGFGRGASQGKPVQQRATFAASAAEGAGGIIARLVHYLRDAFAYAKSALDAVASAVRGVVGSIIETAKSLLGLQPATPSLALNLITEKGVQSEDLAGSLFAAVDLVNSLAAEEVSQTLETIIMLTDTAVEPVINIVDTTTDELFGTVHGTTNQILYTADHLAGVATSALDKLTGGLGQPAGRFAHATIGKADMLADAALPATADTVSKVLGSVNGGFDAITAKLNEISPKIISRLDPEFAVAAEKSRNDFYGEMTKLPGNMLAEPPLLDGPLRKLTSAPLSGDGPLGQAQPLTDGPTCIAGCDAAERAGLPNGGLGRRLKGVSGIIAGGSKSGPVLGLRLGSGGDIGSGGGRQGLVGGLIGGEADSSGSMEGPDGSGAQGGLISSTISTTGSIIENSIGKLKKK